jgi:hypothetical protein
MQYKSRYFHFLSHCIFTRVNAYSYDRQTAFSLAPLSYWKVNMHNMNINLL